jgi:PadR family transcriptional regulator, regulatory protein PadR
MDESKNPSMSATEAIVLDLLADGERFGLELVAASDGRVKRGSVYVTLSRMEAKGFVESRQEERPAGAIGLPRRLYKVTPYGSTVRAAYRSLREAISLRPAEAR